MRDVWQAANLCARIVAVKFVGMIRGFEVGGEIESSDSKDGDVLVEDVFARDGVRNNGCMMSMLNSCKVDRILQKKSIVTNHAFS